MLPDASLMPTTATTPMPEPAAQVAPRRSFGVLELLTAALLLGGPIFYVLGRIFLESYWLGLGVAPSVMSVSTEDYIYCGFVVIATGLTMILPDGDNLAVWTIPLSALVLLVVLALFFWLLKRAKAWLAKRIKKHRRRLRVYMAKGKPVVESIDSAATLISVLSTLALALLLLSAALLVPIVVAHEVGKARAAKVGAELVKPKTPYTRVQVDGVDAGLLVECTSKYCAIYKGGKTHPVPIESVRWNATP